MIVYLVKSTILLGLLWGLYALLLKNEKMHRFNRFYLLIALVIGLTAPLIQFEIQPNANIAGVDLVQVDQIVEAPSQFVVETIEPLVIENPIPEEEFVLPYMTPQYNSFALILILTYIAVAAVFLFKFVFGLNEIYASVKKGTTIAWKDTTLVLLDDEVTPQSFLKWIFLNKKDYESGKIEEEILEHERTHIKQKHSLDVLFIEVLKVVFWFNPFLYGFRNSIMLNHEFLADEHVVTHVSDRTKYQETLMEFATSKVKTSMTNKFASSYSKTRFKMMLKPTSYFQNFSKLTLLLPIAFTTVVLFCTSVSENRSFRNGVEMLEEPELMFFTLDGSVRNSPDRNSFDGLRAFIEPGKPFTGIQKAYNVTEDKLVSETVFKNGWAVSAQLLEDVEEIGIKYMKFEYVQGKEFTQRAFNENDELIKKGVVTYTSEGVNRSVILNEFDASNNIVKHSTYSFMNGGLREAFSINANQDTTFHNYYDEDIYISKEYHPNGQLKYKSGKGAFGYEGLMTLYDEQGNITRQELYEKGELVETIK